MEITLTYTDLAATVKRSLSIIGKRSVDADGNLLFKDVTLGTLEEPILHDFFLLAVTDITTEAESFVTASADESVTLSFPSNHNDALEKVISDACKGYCVSYALYSWFQVVAPRLVEKYLGDCRRLMGSLVRLVNQKKPPTTPQADSADISPLSATTTITSNS